jgi:hypothetical protein
MRIEAGVRDLVQRIGDDQTQVGYSVVERSGGQVIPCSMYIILMVETRSTGFPV